MSFVPSREDIARFCGSSALPNWLDAMARLAPDLCRHYEFDRLDWCHFMGQIGAETNGLSLANMSENMNYTTTKRIVEVFGYRLGLAIKKVKSGQESEPAIARGQSIASLAAKLRGQPRLLADIVYGGREGTPWMQGSRYIGRGPTQCTHLDNYRAVGAEIARQPGGAAIDLVAQPERLATDPEFGIRAAFADWKLMGLSRYAQQDSVALVSDALNTGSVKDNVKPHNLAGRQRWTAKAKAVWPVGLTPGPLASPLAPAVGGPAGVVAGSAEGAPAPSQGLRLGDRGPEVARLQKALNAAGYKVGTEDGIFGTLTRRAVVALQAEHELVVDGVAGPRTWDVLSTTGPADLGERSGITAQTLLSRGSKQIQLWRRVRGLGHWLWVLSGLGVAGEASGLEVVEHAASTANRVSDVAYQFNVPLITPKVWLMLGLAVVGLLGLVLVAWGKSGENDRVQKAQSGDDISK